MAKIMTSKYDANCKDCGAFLPAGSKIRYYGRGKVYGTECHDKDGPHDGWDRERKANGGSPARPRALTMEEMDTWPEGKIRSHYDPTGAYTPDGELIGRTNPNGRCEDAPCCGCCT